MKAVISSNESGRLLNVGASWVSGSQKLSPLVKLELNLRFAWI